MATKLVYVHKAEYQALCAGYKSKADQDGEYIQRHRRAAKNNTGVHLSTSDLERLQSGQPKSDDDDPIATNASDETNGVELPQAFGSTESADNAPTQQTEKQGLSLAESIGQLDPENDDHWTQAGKPAIPAVENLFGKKIKRDDVEAAAPGFDRAIAQQANA